MESANQLTQRQATILEGIVRSYTATGEAVSSTEIANALTPSVSSATVRNDMAQLTEAGYLLQPHTSAGRIPTVEGFRVVTGRLLAHERVIAAQRSQRTDVRVTEVAHRLADRTHAAAFVAMRGRMGTAGFEFVLTAPELTGEEGALASFARIVDALPLWHEQLRGALTGPLSVFIAEENPIAPSRYFSVVAAELPEGGVAAVLGPVRMRYDAAIRSLMAI